MKLPFRRRDGDSDLDEEIQSHIRMAIQERIENGMSPLEADRSARREFGNVAIVKDITRPTRRLIWIEQALQDVKYALRTLRTNPGFTAVAVLLLALGIGANTAVFNVVYTVLLKPLDYPNPGRIVTVSSTVSPSVASRVPSPLWSQVSIPDVNDWRDQSTVFDALAFYVTRSRPITVGRVAEYARVSAISPGFFRVFESAPVAGRVFTADEQKVGGAAVVSRAFAHGHFGDAARAVGQRVRLLDRPLQIVGVLPVGFDFPEHTDIWAPLTVDTTKAPRGQRNYRAVGRLKAGVRLERARVETITIASRLAQQYPESNEGRSVAVIRLHDALVGDVQVTLYLVFGAVTLVLLIACANMTTLLLARATTRTREIAVRAALGASGGRILRQMFVESTVLALLAGVIGVALAVWGTSALVALVPGDVPRLAEVTFDPYVLIFALVTSLIVTLLSVLVPARHASQVDIDRALKQESMRGGTNSKVGRAREALVVGQLAVSVVLLVGGSLLIKSFISLRQVPLGFQPENVLVMRATVLSSDPRGQATLFFKNLLRDVSALPGVLAAGATMAPPGRVDSTSTYYVDRLPENRNSVNAPSAVMSIVGPGTFAALGIAVKSGRDFDDGDTPQGPRVAIINEKLAREALPAREAVGHTIICSFDSFEPMTIVGVVGDVRQLGPRQEPSAECYMPYLQHYYNDAALSLVVRTAENPTSLAETIRRKAHELSPEVPLTFTTMGALMAENVAAPRFRALLVGLFAVVALCLAAIGVFGVTAYVVGQRTAEIGLRVALGASPRAVLWLLLRRALLLTVGGVVAGLAGASLVARFLGSVLFDVKPIDPTTYASVALLLSITSVLASYLPARRATNLDPLVALHCE